MGRQSETPRSAKRWYGIEWATLFWITLLHGGALAAPFYFTWSGLVTAILLGWITGGLGVCLGFHRLLAHRSYETYRSLRRLIALLGTLAGQGPPITWVAVHRKHHLHSDQPGDPHSPRDGAWWSHMLWLLPKRGSAAWRRRYQRFAPDLLAEPFMRFLSKSALAWHFALGLALFGTGYLIGGSYTGISWVVYGVFVRLVYVLHITWLVNSATHMWGYRRYETSDDSRNLWWVGLLSGGEGWHNNHHAFQRGARHGHRWWEVDTTYMAIWMMERFGLAWKVVRGVPRQLERASPSGS